MATTPLLESGRLRLIPFDPHHATSIARWPISQQELSWLAPTTTPPLTAEKVLLWKKEGGVALQVQEENGDLLAYGEINPMHQTPHHDWLGHIVVSPVKRGQGIGRSFIRTLVEHSFRRRGARMISLVVFPDNAAAIRCYEHAGFRYVRDENHQFNGTGPFRRLLRFEIASA